MLGNINLYVFGFYCNKHPYYPITIHVKSWMVKKGNCYCLLTLILLLLVCTVLIILYPLLNCCMLTVEGGGVGVMNEGVEASTGSTIAVLLNEPSQTFQPRGPLQYSNNEPAASNPGSGSIMQWHVNPPANDPPVKPKKKAKKNFPKIPLSCQFCKKVSIGWILLFGDILILDRDDEHYVYLLR